MFLVFAAAAAVRILPAVMVPQSPLTLDAAGYDRLAVNLCEGKGLTSDGVTPSLRRPPLYPAFLAFLYKVVGQDQRWVRLAQGLLGAASCLLIYAMGSLLFSEPVGLWAAWIMALHPVMIAYNQQFLTETLYTFLLLASLYFFLTSLATGKNGGTIAAGLLLALANLCRPTTLFLPLFLLAAPVVLGISQFRRHAKAGILLCLVAALGVAPWTLRNFRVSGKFVPVALGGGYALWVGSQVPEGRYPERAMERAGELIAPAGWESWEGDQRLSDLAKEQWKEHPGKNILDLPRRFLHFWFTSHSSVFGIEKPNGQYWQEKNFAALAIKGTLWFLQLGLLVLAGAGLLQDRSLEKTGPLVFVLVYFTLFHILTDYGPNRYHVPVLPYLFLFAAVFLRRVLKPSVIS